MTTSLKGFTLYEINSRPWLYELRLKYGEDVVKTIADVPDEELQRLKKFSVHMVWLQGAWSLGDFGLQMDRTEPGRVSAYGKALPGFTKEDIIGSPYAVVEYEINEELGGTDALKKFRERLAALDIKLMLDLVPNHMAVDSVWMKDPDKKDYFVRKPTKQCNFNPDEFMENGTAHGKDPYCGAWPDTAQLNYFNPALRREMTDVLIHIASMCDGIRVDMAMLLINKVHAQCWGDVLSANGWTTPDTEFWEVAIKEMREEFPETILMAEVYWGLDEELIRQGFNSTYDKAVYDIAQSKHLDNLRGYIWSKTEAFMAHSTHFVENHDEPRAVTEFGGKMQANCTAAILFTLPGIRLQFHGQWSGKSRPLDVHLRRGEDEERDEKNERFYCRLNKILSNEIFQLGEWKPVAVYDAGCGDRQSWRMVACRWTYQEMTYLFCANYSEEEAGGHIVCDTMSKGSSGDVDVVELLSEKTYSRNAEELKSKGIFIWLKPWQMQIFEYK